MRPPSIRRDAEMQVRAQDSFEYLPRGCRYHTCSLSLSFVSFEIAIAEISSAVELKIKLCLTIYSLGSPLDPVPRGSWLNLQDARPSPNVALTFSRHLGLWRMTPRSQTRLIDGGMQMQLLCSTVFVTVAGAVVAAAPPGRTPRCCAV